MKKFLAGIAAAAIITVPMTSFALESMSKGALKKATGQAGVSIALDNIVIYQSSQPTTTYWDMDGTSSIAGTIGQNTRTGLRIGYEATAEKLITIGGILTNQGNGYSVAALTTKFGSVNVGIADQTAAGYDPSTGHAMVMDTSTTPATMTAKVATNNFSTKIAPLTIDVGTCQSLTDGLSYNRAIAVTGQPVLDVAGVVIGLPTVEINTYHTNDTKIISVVSTNPTLTANSGATGQAALAAISNEMIRIEKSGASKMAILGGRLEIAPH